MGYIHCCSGLRKCKTFRIAPTDGYFIATLNMLEACPVCGHKVVLVARINYKHEYSEVRKANNKAVSLFERLKTSIIYEVKKEFRINQPNQSSALCYNDSGVKKKCYSNLSAITLGLFESLDLPKEKRIFIHDVIS